MDRAITLRDVGAAVWLSASEISRIERGVVAELDLVLASRLLAAVGLELSVRVYPTGEPIRDAAHERLLSAFRGVLHPSLRWRREVPMPIPGDLRAWDAVVTGRGWSVGIEAELAPRDLQALQRRVALKLRDARLDGVVLLIPDTRRNRLLLREHADGLRDAFPVPGARTLELLRVGMPPPGSALVVLPLPRGPLRAG